MARVLPPTPANLNEAAEVLASGGIVGMPTETVYGLAARALDPDAVARIYRAKARPSFNPLIAHIPRALCHLDRLAAAGIVETPRMGQRARVVAETLFARSFPGPLTLILPRGPAIPDLPAAGLDTVGIRCPDHAVAQELLARVDGPLAAPSANRSGGVSPTSAQDVAAELADHLDIVLDGGPCRVGLESTVAYLDDDGTLTVLRPGAVSMGQLSSWIGAPVGYALKTTDAPRSPGMTNVHYAPRAALVPLGRPHASLSQSETDLYPQDAPLLCWTEADARAAIARGRVAAALTTRGDPAEAARRLFATLRTLDQMGTPYILVDPCPPGEPADGLELAIADRLGRAGGRAVSEAGTLDPPR